MPTKATDRVTVRVDPQLKATVQHDLDAMGLDMSTLITMTFKQIALTHRLPFTPDANAPIDVAFANIKNGKVVRHGSLEDYIQEVMNYDDTTDSE
jgi:DNA-damage-inducible protein J